ncbi:gluconokinase [Thalassotalea montiporae]
MNNKQILIIGPSGCGKSSLGQVLATKLGCDFLDADNVHSPAAITQMKQGIPLTEELRAPWLAKLTKFLNEYAINKASVVMAVSCLKKAHRELLKRYCNQPVIFYLDLSESLLHERLTNRKEHFFPAALLDSQLTTLEKPRQDEEVITLDASLPIIALCQACIEQVKQD